MTSTQSKAPGRCPTRNRAPTVHGVPSSQRASAEPSQSHRGQSSTRDQRAHARSAETGTITEPVHAALRGRRATGGEPTRPEAPCTMRRTARTEGDPGEMSESPRTIEALQIEDRVFPPPPEFARAAVAGPELYERAAADLEGFWAEEASRLEWIEPWNTGLRPLQRAVLQVVRGGQAQRQRQLPRPAPEHERRPGRLPLGGRAGRHRDDHLPRPARAGLPPGQRAAGAGRGQGRPGRDLPGHGPGDRRWPCWPAPASARAHTVVFGGFSADSPARPHHRLRAPRS